MVEYDGTVSEEMKRLYSCYETMLPELLKEHRGEFVVFADEKPSGFYKTFLIASEESVKKYGLEKMFIIQEVTDVEPVDFVFSARL